MLVDLAAGHCGGLCRFNRNRRLADSARAVWALISLSCPDTPKCRRLTTGVLSAIERDSIANGGLSGSARGRVGDPGGGDAGSHCAKYYYRLPPHISDTPLTTVNTSS
jgi:hypothetical protein